MKINDSTRTPQAESPGKANPAVPRPNPQELEPAADKTTDRAELSAVGRDALTTTAPAKLEALRRQIDSGAYQVSAEEMAKAIVEAHIRK
jgi:anti-sigma28 factor (negative regulator of flagellin synthesis)